MKNRTIIGDMLWLTCLIAITALFILPNTGQLLIQLTNNHPYWMGFFKFAVLASMGELLVLRFTRHAWSFPAGMAFKIVVWGLIGMLITFMFAFYSIGISAMVEQGKIPVGEGIFAQLIPAFLTSAIMNLTFGIVFMGLHRISDTYIDMRVNNEKPSLNALIKVIDWDGFISFVVLKTIPIFWIPAHTITFMLPAHYRVIVAAYLSIVLGVILVYAKRRT